MDSASPDDDRTVLRPSGSSAPASTEPPEGSAPDAPTPTRHDPPPASEPNDDGHNALAVGTMLGEFEIQKVIGEGGFGIVYLAQDTSLKRRVALKEYMPAELAARRNNMQITVISERHRETFEMGMRSFINEAHVLAQFDHPSLVRVHRFWEANGTAYMVMPFVEGTTLKDKLKAFGKPPAQAPDEAWLMGLLAPLTEALSVIHAEHCYHRDIAPDNIILLAGTGRPMLLDFGAARQVIGDRTQALTAILKHGYAPIEQYAEAPGMKQGPWTDVYALGALLHFAITGNVPPPSVARILDDSYRPLEQVAAGRYSADFLRAIDHALQVRPEQRTQTVAQLREELGIDGAIDHGRTVAVAAKAPAAAKSATKSATKAAPPPAAAGASKLWLALGGIGVVAVGSVALMMSRGGPAPAPAPVAAASAAAPAEAQVAALPASAAAPAPTPAAAPAPAPFTLTGQFDLIEAAQAPGFTVTATPAKDKLRIDRDKISFTVSANRDGHVYVLWKDPDGALYLMYPNKKAADKMLRAGQKLTLPGADWQLDTTKPVGHAQLLVMVSQHPRDFSIFGSQYEYLFQKLPIGEDAATMARGFEGVGSVLAGRAQCDGPKCDVYGAAQFGVDVVP